MRRAISFPRLAWGFSNRSTRSRGVSTLGASIRLAISFLVLSGAGGSVSGQRVVLRPVGDPIRTLSREELIQVITGTASLFGAERFAEGSLRAEIALIPRTIPLSEPQCARFTRAGLADIHRFMSRLESTLDGLPKEPVGQDQAERAATDLRRLAIRYHMGLFGRSSLYQKTIRTSLPPEDLTRFEEWMESRRRNTYRDVLEATLDTYRSRVPWPEVRRRLVEVLLAETAPPDGCGRGTYEVPFMLYALSRVPEEKVRAGLDDNQWKVIKLLRESGANHLEWFREDGESDALASGGTYAN